MFHPEVLKPFGVETPVTAFGLAIERLIKIRLRIHTFIMFIRAILAGSGSCPSPTVWTGMKFNFKGTKKEKGIMGF